MASGGKCWASFHDCLLVIMCFGLAVTTHRYLGYAVVALLVEVNSVFLHIRQMLIVQGVPKHNKWYRLNSLLNVATFLVFRITTLGWMTRWLVVHRDSVPLFAYTLSSTALATLFAMNIVLFFRVLYADFRKVRREGGVRQPAPNRERIDSAFRQLVRGTEEEEIFSDK